MPIYNGNYAAPVWVNGVPPTIGATELEAMTGTAERSQVLHGSGAPGSGTAGEIGQLYADMSASPVEFYRMTGLSAGGGFIWESEHDIEDNLTTTYDSSATYAAGDFCLYGGLLYEAAVDILTPEEWTAAHWRGVTAADAETAHFARRDNPHEVTAAQVGLGNVENALQYSAANPAIKRGTVALEGTWSGAASPYTKIITVTGPTVTAKSYVELQFTPAQMDSLMSRGVRAVHVYNNGGVLTAMAWGGVPGNMTAQCTVEELDSVEIVSFTNGPNEKVGAMIDAAHNGIIDLQITGGWRVGDKRTITIGPFSDGGSTYYEQQTMTIAISSFEDYNSCGCVMQFDFVESITPTHQMNNDDTSRGGYGNTILYSEMLPNMAEALPDWIKNRLITFTVLSSSGNKSTIIDTVENNKLALRSEVEVFGTTTYSAAGEGTQVQYYETESNRVKPLGYNGSAKNWWERSPDVTTNGMYCRVSSTGEAGTTLAGYDVNGVSPFGCL